MLLPMFIGSDYEGLQPIGLELDSETTVACAEMTIRDDELYEGPESFLVSLTSINSDVDIPVSSASVLVTDNDGEFDLRSRVVKCYTSFQKSSLDFNHRHTQ